MTHLGWAEDAFWFDGKTVRGNSSISFNTSKRMDTPAVYGVLEFKFGESREF